MKRLLRSVAYGMTASTCLLAALPLYGVELPSWMTFKKRDARPQSPSAEEEFTADDFDTKAHSRLLGEYTRVEGRGMLKLQGIGLVVGLDGTGEDPAPSAYREAIELEMKKNNVDPKEAKEILRSPNSTIVIVTAYIPPLIRDNERFDVEVQLPRLSKATSLNGGILYSTRLKEYAFLEDGGALEGHTYAIAKGPILVSVTGSDATDRAGLLKRGRIVGGGKSMIDRNLDIYLRNDFRAQRNSVRVANTIGKRFFEYDKYNQNESLAKPKTDQHIELKVAKKYRDNYPRYIEVIRNIAFGESDVARQVRLHKLQAMLHDADTSYNASLQLEAIGDQSISILKTGLQSKDLEVRFHSAAALAYLNDSSGLQILTDAARDEFAFRIYALAAMTTLEDPEVNLQLRDLMNGDSAETRYGAFRALTTLDKNDPFVKGKRLNDQFTLHVLSTTGTPMIHLTNRKKTEIVSFGADQQIIPPLAARAGAHIIVTSDPASDKVLIRRSEVGREGEKKIVSLRLDAVIEGLAELGAAYPDTAEFLTQCSRQGNLPGRLEVDALPQAGRYYERSKDGGASKSKRRIGNVNSTPNIFSIDAEKKANPASPGDDEPADERSGEASVVDARSAKEAKSAGKDASKGKGVSKSAPTQKPVAKSAVVTADAKVEPHAKGGTIKQTSAETGKAAADDDLKALDRSEAPAKPGGVTRFFKKLLPGERGVSGNTEPTE